MAMTCCTHAPLVLAQTAGRGVLFVMACQIGAVEANERGETRITVQGNHLYVRESAEAVVLARNEKIMGAT